MPSFKQIRWNRDGATSGSHDCHPVLVAPCSSSWSTARRIQADTDRLIPICNKHHHLVHERGWQLHLAPDRTLTITQPGGTESRHGPPTIRAA